MARRIEDRVDPWLLAEREDTLEGHVPLKELPRLSLLLVDDTGEATVHFVFGKDSSGRSIVHSSIKAELKLECQRCLQPMSHAVDATGDLALVRGPMEAEQLPAELDPLLVQEDEVLQIPELVEDELLLSIPISPRHEKGTCQGQAASLADDAIEEDPAEEVRNPFAVLAGLKTGSATDS